ncbi:MAG: PIN domain-containing protein [Atopobiaceae bacterium]|nr:PIN domain-containing protein [Atopobiaceae bacterium]MBR3314272.1 PIN domain-containing protein [Atopobiaceae bacterium]
MSGGMRIMVDTCVWVDNYCPDHVGCKAARSFFDQALSLEAELLYAVHACKDVLYVLEHEFKRAAKRELGSIDESQARAARSAAWACMRNMCELATAVGADGSDVWLAEKYRRIHSDFEDNLVLAACKRANANYLVTNDKSLIAHADVLAKTPRQMSELFKLP